MHFEVFHHLTFVRPSVRGSVSSQAKTETLPLNPLSSGRHLRGGSIRNGAADFDSSLAIHTSGYLQEMLCRLQAAHLNRLHQGLSGFADPFSDVGHEVRHAQRPDDRNANSRAYLTRHLPLSAFLTPSGVCSFESSAVFFHPATAHRISITGSGWQRSPRHPQGVRGLRVTQPVSWSRTDHHASAITSPALRRAPSVQRPQSPIHHRSANELVIRAHHHRQQASGRGRTQGKDSTTTHQRDHGSDHQPGKPDIRDPTSNSPKRIQQFRCPCELTADPEESATRTQLLLSRSGSGTDTRLECSHPLTTRLPKQTVTKGQDMSLTWRPEDLPEPHPEASLLAPRPDDTLLRKCTPHSVGATWNFLTGHHLLHPEGGKGDIKGPVPTMMMEARLTSPHLTEEPPTFHTPEGARTAYWQYQKRRRRGRRRDPPQEQLNPDGSVTRHWRASNCPHQLGAKPSRATFPHHAVKRSLDRPSDH